MLAPKTLILKFALGRDNKQPKPPAFSSGMHKYTNALGIPLNWLHKPQVQSATSIKVRVNYRIHPRISLFLEKLNYGWLDNDHSALSNSNAYMSVRELLLSTTADKYMKARKPEFIEKALASDEDCRKYL